ncbi:MAG: 50S ribosomal protein L29 [Candidatus Berkelbacteria bacterium]|nr:50S ribosomal protein L29 [Candidatus Berkelbacteria bacterium]
MAQVKTDEIKKMSPKDLLALLDETERNILKERAKIASSGKKNSDEIRKLKLKIARIKTKISSR